MIQDQRSLLNEIFLPLTDTSWELIPRTVLTNLGLHRNTLLFFSEKYDSLVLLLIRREPSEDTFVGNFPCSCDEINWMHSMIRTPNCSQDEGVKWAYVATIENARVNEVLSFAQVSEVIERTRNIEPFVSRKSGSKFFWLDQDLFPAKIYSHRRAFREVRHVPKFMRKSVHEAAE